MKGREDLVGLIPRNRVEQVQRRGLVPQRHHQPAAQQLRQQGRHALLTLIQPRQGTGRIVATDIMRDRDEGRELVLGIQRQQPFRDAGRDPDPPGGDLRLHRTLQQLRVFTVIAEGTGVVERRVHMIVAQLRLRGRQIGSGQTACLDHCGQQHRQSCRECEKGADGHGQTSKFSFCTP